MWSSASGTWGALAATVLARSVIIVLLAGPVEPARGAASTASDHGETKARETGHWLSPVVRRLSLSLTASCATQLPEERFICIYDTLLTL